MVRAIVVLLSIAVTAGCGPAQYEDVSNLPTYSALVGNKYRTLRHLQVLGITTDRDYEPVVDYYLIMGTPSIAGPEVAERRALPAGSLVEVVNAMLCTNCVLPALRLEARIGSGEGFGGKPVFVDDRGDLVGESADGRSIVLNSDVFELYSK